MSIYGPLITINTYREHTRQQRYRSEIDQLIDRSQHPKPDILWHYTSSEVLPSILISNRLRFTHASSFADKDEVNHPIRFARIILDTLLPSTKGSLDKLLMKKIGDQMIASNADSRWFVSCFTDSKESDFHWGNYSSGFSGCCIGFDSKELFNFLSLSPDDRPLILKTVYATQEMINFGSAVLSFGINNFKQDYGHLEDVNSAMDQFLYEWGRCVDPASVMFKQEKFSEEREWRLGRCIESATSDDQPFIDGAGKRRWDVTRGYMSDSVSEKLPIRQIVIGKNSQLAESDLLNLLTENGFLGVDVSKQGT